MENTLILGFGSPVLSDEGIVPLILQKLKKDIDSGFEMRSELTLSLDHIKYFNVYKSILIIDTVISPEDKVGEVKVYPVEDYIPTLHLENIHDICLPDLIGLARELGYKIPEKIIIIAINILDHKTISTGFTNELKGKFDKVFSEVKKVARYYFSIDPANQMVTSKVTD